MANRRAMINQLEVPMYLEESLPELSFGRTITGRSSAYDLMNNLVAFTCNNIQGHNYKVVKRAFQIAGKLYDKGNAVVKNAVQNVFVYSFTRIFQNYPSEKQQLLSMLPMTLYTLYIAQVCHKGC